MSVSSRSVFETRISPDLDMKQNSSNATERKIIPMFFCLEQIDTYWERQSLRLSDIWSVVGLNVAMGFFSAKVGMLMGVENGAGHVDKPLIFYGVEGIGNT